MSKVNYEKLEKVLEKGKDIIKEEKFGELIKGFQKDLLFKFIEDFTQEEKSSKKDMEYAEKILRIAKGYYTYANQGDTDFTIIFIKDVLYDALLASFKRKGGVEPFPYLPDSLKRVEPADDTLVNFNMSRTHRIYDEDEIPNGVSEQSSVESIMKEIYKAADLKKGDEVEILLAPKIDGAALSTSINKGKFELPTQKGQKEGKAVLVKGLKGFRIPNPEYNKCNVQYEVFMSNEQRKTLAKEFDTDYKNNRNTVAGLITKLANSDDDEANKAILNNIYFYPIIATDTDDDDNWKKMMKKIDSMGIIPKNMIERKIIKGDRATLIEEIKKYYDVLSDMREDLDFSIDGVVITFIDKSIRKELGRKDGANQYQFALKFAPASSRVKVESIYLSSGKLGDRTPMVKFSPVEIDGRVFKEAAFNTLADFRKFQVSIGDEILLVIAGDVIPKITMDDTCKRASYRNPLTDFHICPACSVTLTKTDNKYRCDNIHCRDNITGRFAHFFEKIGIEYGESTARDIYGITKSPYISDILKITEAQLKEIGYKSKATKFIKDFQDALSKINEYELLGYVGIGGLQKKTAKKIIEQMSLKDLLDMPRNTREMKLELIDGFGAASAMRYSKGIDHVEKDLRELMKHISKEKPNFTNMKVVGFTGLTPDDKLTNLIKALGWDTTDGQKFDYLITASKNREGKKMDKANEKQIPIYTREEFMKEFAK
jgi:DNA ligase (NAD+)